MVSITPALMNLDLINISSSKTVAAPCRDAVNPSARTLQATTNPLGSIFTISTLFDTVFDGPTLFDQVWSRPLKFHLFQHWFQGV